MLITHHSNRLEALATALAERMASAPLPPMTQETVVVPHRSMGHWLSIELAERSGIAANVDFPFLGGLVWRLFQAHWPELPETSAFDREALRWRVMAGLPGVLGEPGFEPLRAYLADSDHPNGVKAYQLADRLASLYDQYLVYRPDWIAAWEAGKASHWQAALWRTLVGGETAGHRASLLQRYVEALAGGSVADTALPPHITVFGVSSAPPAYVELLARIAERVPVDVYVLNPSLHYWGDVVSERGLAKLRELWRRRGLEDVGEYYSIGNPLLASLGRTGREFLETLQGHSADDEYHFAEPGEEALTQLQQIQTDILYLQSRGVDTGVEAQALDAPDGSMALHACHSPMREVQVLHDQLRAMFEATDLRPRDVVVMTPDIDRYAPYIEAVFGNAAGNRYIPWSVTDRALPGVHPVIQVFISLLALPQSRLAASEILSILEVPAVHRAFDLDADAVERIRAWVRESGIRWGADAGHRAEAGLPAQWETHSWRFGFNRLMLGYAMDDETRLYGDIAPLPQVEGGQAAWLGGFRAFWEQLLALRERMRGEHDPARWQTVFNEALDGLLRPADAEESLALQNVRDAVAAMVDATAAAGFEGTLPLQTVKAHLLDALDNDGQHGGFLTGQVTFCAMVPMRSVPFQVVCLIGLNDQAFPRQSPPMAFDLMARHPRPGDRSLREDDRYLFLEALLSARRTFYVSYVGRSIRDDSEKLPSVLVNELLDTVDRSFRTSGEAAPGARLLTHHPLQPFSPRYDGDRNPPLFSYARDWLRVEEGPEPPMQGLAVFADGALPPPEESLRDVSLEELIRFLRRPAEGFLRLRLGTRVQQEAVSEADSEPFDLDSLNAYQLRDFLLEQRLHDHDRAELERLLEAMGSLPEGPFGRAVMDEMDGQIRRFQAHLGEQLPAPGEPVEIDLALDGFTLTGWLTGVGPDGLFSYRPALIRPHDRLRAWVKHLALNAAAPPGVNTTTRHLGEGGKTRPPELMRLAPVPADEARAHLADLLAIYWQGLQSPVPFFVKSSYAYAERLVRKDDIHAAENAARRAWEGNSFSEMPGECEEPDNATVFRGREPLDERAFADLALRVFEPMLKCPEGGDDGR